MKVKDLSEEKEKIIQLWKADEKVLALILARSIMTDKQVLEFCIESEDINTAFHQFPRNNWPLKSHILTIHVYNSREDEFNLYNQEYWTKHYGECRMSYKNERSKIAAFNKFLNHICGNKRIKK